jgi:hypothetical protein
MLPAAPQAPVLEVVELRPVSASFTSAFAQLEVIEALYDSANVGRMGGTFILIGLLRMAVPIRPLHLLS